LHQPHGSAIVDIDGDCNPDVALVMDVDDKRKIIFFSSYAKRSTGAEVEVRWRRLKVERAPTAENNNTLHSLDVTLLENAGHPSFFDTNADAFIDIVYPVEVTVGATLLSSGKKHLEVMVIRNEQLKFCSNTLFSSGDCREAQELCQVCPNGICKDITLLDAKKVGQIEEFEAEDKIDDVWLRQGDYNNDMYPDLLVLEKKKVHILTANVHDPDNIEYLPENDPFIHEKKIVRNAFFASGPNFGWKDILIQTEAGGVQVYEWTQINANQGYTYHLTLSGLNGVCIVSSTKLCPPRPNSGGTELEGYGQNYPGFVARFSSPNFKGQNVPRVGIQLSQQAHLALQEPNIHFGLSRSNNFVSKFFAGFSVPPNVDCPREKGEYNRLKCPYYREFRGQPIIPNTMIRVIPHRREYPDEWEIHLGVRPAKHILTILMVAGSVLAVLGALIVFNEYRDRKKEEKRQYKDFRVHFIG